MEVLRAHAAGEDEIRFDARAGTSLSTKIGDGGDLVPPEKCPNCGSEVHADQDVCPQCGHMRALPPSAVPSNSGPERRSAGGMLGAAAVGCGGAFLAAIVCLIGFVFIGSLQLSAAIDIGLEVVLAVLLFFGFRAIIGRNPGARPALYAFVVVFVVLFGGIASCFASFYNNNFH